MTTMEKTVAALIRCVPATAFEAAMADIERENPDVAPNMNVENTIADLAVELGVPGHIKGHRYIITAVRILIENPDAIDAITKELYPGVAKEHNTTSSRVERAIRHAIEITWDRIDMDVLARYFGCTISPDKGKPTNSEFLSRVANIIRRRIMEG